MKLYELKKGDRFIFKGDDEVFTFDHVDGMYSVCISCDGNIFHPAAFSEVTLEKDV